MLVQVAAASADLGEQLFGLGRAGIATHGLAVQVQHLADPRDAHTVAEQGMDLRVPSSRVLLTHLRCLRHPFQRWAGRHRPGCARRFGRLAQAFAVGSHDPVDRRGQVAQQVPAVGDLDRLRGALTGAFGIGAAAVSADDADAGMPAKPGGDGVGVTIIEQVDRAVGGHVDDHGAVDVAAPHREVVHSDFDELLGGGTGTERTSRSRVDRDASAASSRVIRAPARPPRAKPIPVNSLVSIELRR